MGNPFIQKKIRTKEMIRPENQSAGILDDHAVRHSISTREGTIERVPTRNDDIVNKKFVDDSIAAIPPGSEATGSIKMFGSFTPPAGWINCDGSLISRATYAALFAVIGETFGAGDGVNTFKIPWMSNRFPMGADVGNMGQEADIDTHQHAAISAGTPSGTNAPSVSGINSGPTITQASAVGHTHVFTGNAMAAHQHAAESHIPPYQIVNFIIKT